MRFDGTYVSWGTRSVIFKTEKGECYKVYRRKVRPHLPRKEFDLLMIAYRNGLRVPEPIELLDVELSDSLVGQIKDKEYRKEFGEGKSFAALRRKFIDGRVMGKRWLPSKQVWDSYKEVNEKLFALGYTAYDFIPHNYIVDSQGEVYLIDLDRALPISSEEIPSERKAMEKVPNTHFGRAVFDVKAWILRNTWWRVLDAVGFDEES